MSVRVSRLPLRIPRAYAELEDRSSGGVVLFVGRVRPDRSAGGEVGALFYEAHVPVAERALRALEREARRRFGARRIVLWHRTGNLAVGVPSVIVGAAAPHREEAFAAARWMITELKRSVPIWKTDRKRSSVRRGRTASN